MAEGFVAEELKKRSDTWERDAQKLERKRIEEWNGLTDSTKSTGDHGSAGSPPFYKSMSAISLLSTQSSVERTRKSGASPCAAKNERRGEEIPHLERLPHSSADGVIEEAKSLPRCYWMPGTVDVGCRPSFAGLFNPTAVECRESG